MKKCCENCIADNQLGFYILKYGIINDCDYCSQINVKCIDLDDNIFERIFNFISKAYVKTPFGYGDKLYDLVQSEWEIFLPERQQVKLFKDLCDNFNIDSKANFEYNPEFTHYIDLWNNYKHRIKHENRFINSLPNEIERLLSSQSKWFKYLSEGTILYRARIGCIQNEKTLALEPYPANKVEMGMPSIGKARAGRANPDGIPYLYLANNKDTVVAEVRPWAEAMITIASISLVESITPINFSCFHGHSIFDYLDENIESSLNRLSLFSTLSEELSQPVSPDDSYLEYLPTQYLTEFIKNQGYAGIIFDSSLGNAQNIVLFDEDLVEVKSTELCRTLQVTYHYTEA